LKKDNTNLKIGAIVAFVAAVLLFGSNLTGYVTAASPNTALIVEPTTLTSIQINGNSTTCSFGALKFTSPLNKGIIIGANSTGGQDETNVVWLLLKSRQTSRYSAGCDVYNGRWIYANNSTRQWNTIR